MATCNLHTRIRLRSDSPQEWYNNNPVLLEGEVGCAIDKNTGITTIKVGDGIHHWRDLGMELGIKEEALKQATNDMTEALQKIQRTAASCGISMQEAMNALAQFSKTAEETTLLPGDTARRAKYKTLNYKHEVE